MNILYKIYDKNVDVRETVSSEINAKYLSLMINDDNFHVIFQVVTRITNNYLHNFIKNANYDIRYIVSKRIDIKYLISYFEEYNTARIVYDIRKNEELKSSKEIEKLKKIINEQREEIAKLKKE